MNKIEKTIGNLNSSNKNTRYEACEELSTAGSLPESAIIALESATNDPDPLVADASRGALAIHKPYLQQKNPSPFPVICHSRSLQGMRKLSQFLNRSHCGRGF